mmetsp:Transcript_4040/g.6072  ORF Transcript_4040/g.6072 Transcript_4040/m.6072 type:complete len:242 (-) Transcript_4040:417-1142(-)
MKTTALTVSKLLAISVLHKSLASSLSAKEMVLTLFSGLFSFTNATPSGVTCTFSKNLYLRLEGAEGALAAFLGGGLFTGFGGGGFDDGIDDACLSSSWMLAGAVEKKLVWREATESLVGKERLTLLDDKKNKLLLRWGFANCLIMMFLVVVVVVVVSFLQASSSSTSASASALLLSTCCCGVSLPSVQASATLPKLYSSGLQLGNPIVSRSTMRFRMDSALEPASFAPLFAQASITLLYVL